MNIQKVNNISNPCGLSKGIKKIATAAILSTAVLAGASAVDQSKNVDTFQKAQVEQKIDDEALARKNKRKIKDMVRNIFATVFIGGALGAAYTIGKMDED